MGDPNGCDVHPSRLVYAWRDKELPAQIQAAGITEMRFHLFDDCGVTCNHAGSVYVVTQWKFDLERVIERTAFGPTWADRGAVLDQCIATLSADSVARAKAEGFLP